MLKQFGAKPTKANREKYTNSPYWNGKIFENLEVTTTDVSFQTLPKILYKQFCKKEDREPKQKLTIVPFKREAFDEPSRLMKAVWYGHSAVLMKMKSINILIDPMFGDNAAPISPFPVRRFSDDTMAILDALPDIDLVLFTHDHYDHLDYECLLRLKDKTKHFFVALGVGRHLIKWGVEKERITEFSWWDTQTFEDIIITFTPTRHFAGRGLSDRNKSLWGGWAFKTADENIWFSGDSGYGDHFKTVGERLGPFDFAFMECGQYNEHWSQIHMFPEESVQAAIDARVKRAMPVHWCGFALAQHSWTDPVERFTAEAKNRNLDYSLPKLGELFASGSELKTPWWEEL